MKLSLIVAMATNRVIGLNNQMPWHLSADLKRFKTITMGSTLLMGRKTFESIGRPLPNRTNIIISRNLAYQQAGCLVFNSLEQALASVADEQEVFVIGGSALYEATLALANTLYITEINQEFLGDTFFPVINNNEWCEIASEAITNDPTVCFSYRFLTLEKRCL